MMNSDPIGLWLVASVGTGFAAHVAIAAWHRYGCVRLREAYVNAVSVAQDTGRADALVRAQELHQQFIRATPPSWLTGLGGHLKAAFVFCAIAGTAAMVTAGLVPPVAPGVAALFAIGLRRILLATALLVLLFAFTSILAPPYGHVEHSPRAHAGSVSTPCHVSKLPPRPR
jgi:hypothetical protein